MKKTVTMNGIEFKLRQNPSGIALTKVQNGFVTMLGEWKTANQALNYVYTKFAQEYNIFLAMVDDLSDHIEENKSLFDVDPYGYMYSRHEQVVLPFMGKNVIFRILITQNHPYSEAPEPEDVQIEEIEIMNDDVLNEILYRFIDEAFVIIERVAQLAY